MQKDGYLILELMVTLLIVSSVVLIVAATYWHILLWHKEGELYIKATNYALNVASELKKGSQPSVAPKGFELHIKPFHFSKSVPFILNTIVVTFYNLRGQKKELIVYAMIDATHET